MKHWNRLNKLPPGHEGLDFSCIIHLEELQAPLRTSDCWEFSFFSMSNFYFYGKKGFQLKSKKQREGKCKFLGECLVSH